MARLMVLVFFFAIVGFGVWFGSMVLGAPSPFFLGSLAEQLDPPVDPVAADDAARELFTVRPGATALQIGDELKQRNLIRSSVGFRRVVDQKAVGASLAAGEYELSRSMSTSEIVDVLARGEVKRGIVLTVPEGWRAEQVADRLEVVGFASREEFLRAVANPRLIPGIEQLLADPPPTLEGYLFPWTYEVKERVSGAQAAELMLREFAQRGYEPLRRAAGSGLSAHQLLTLASIVEREAQRPEERALIASVFLNRLEEGMRLQADPTVQYVVANRDLRAAAGFGYWKNELTPTELQIDSPFNTYTRQGLPPTPICAPGEASIQAVANPARTGYLYFVARGDGSHAFANTLDEHNANIASVR